MSTRSSLGILNADGTVTGIYCHNDGYIQHHGPILGGPYYATEEKVRALVALGDISSLDIRIGEKHDFDKRPRGQCNVYGRDRGEKHTETRTWPTVDAYVKKGDGIPYLFTPGKGWEVLGGYGWTSVAAALDVAAEAEGP